MKRSQTSNIFGTFFFLKKKKICNKCDSVERKFKEKNQIENTLQKQKFILNFIEGK